jgi:DNA-binding NarL/FixJ family response regulator
LPFKKPAGDADETRDVSVRVVVIDPHEASRERLALLLERAGCTVAASLGTTGDTVTAIDRLTPDVVLVDADGHEDASLQLAAAIRSSPACPSVVLYVADPSAPALRDARRSGLHPIAVKRAGVTSLLELLGSAAADRPRADALEPEFVTTVKPVPPLSVLSPRENEILELLSHGLTGESIAQRLVLSAETVKTHIRNAMLKLEASTRVHAIAIAIRRGYLSPGVDAERTGEHASSRSAVTA